MVVPPCLPFLLVYFGLVWFGLHFWGILGVASPPHTQITLGSPG